MNDKKGDEIKGHDMGLRYDNRVVRVEIYVNTDADHEKIAKALFNRARGPRMDAALIAISVYEGQNGKEIWETIQDVARSEAATPGGPGEKKDV